MKKTILILLHQYEQHLSTLPFTIRFLKQEWEQMDFAVKVAYGTRHPMAADIAINHVDMNVTPQTYLKYLQAYPVVVNGRVADISKTLFSGNILSPDDGYDGKVIIKTKANAGGKREQCFKPKLIRKVQGYTRRLREGADGLIRKFTWSRVKTLESTRYPIFDSIRNLPPGVWENQNLIVEKFLPETDRDGNYYLRAWSFLGDKSLNVLTRADSPVIKRGVIKKREILSDTVPEELVSVRRQMGFDYGRFDYALVNGKVVLYDVNRTPTISPKALEAYSHKIKEMAKGILSF